MKNLTLTPRDLEQYAESGRHALHLFLGQYALIAPKFPTVTDEAVAAMIARVKADPTGTPKTPGIDHAVYFAALFRMGAGNLDAAIQALAHGADAGALHSILQQTTACAGAINALTLVSRDGLMPQLHVDEAQSVARKTVASKGGSAKNARTNAAKAWVLTEWETKGAIEYENNKTQFAKQYENLVPLEFPGVTASAKTIKDIWLP